MSIDTIKHNHAKRPLIPSKEEAGYESQNEIVTDTKVSEIPLNPVVTRGQDPELYWLNKYGENNLQQYLTVDIRSLYRSEHIAPQMLIEKLYRYENPEQKDLFEMFGQSLQSDEIDLPAKFYKHMDNWSNRMILGDSLLVMNSLLEREGMAGKVQMIYIDPPYGIKYGSNWQMKLNNRNVKDGNDDDLTGQPEQVKAYRDTWELGIHSYLSYLRDRLLVAKELLTDSGSCFLQINDTNEHLVRSVMDEVFGSSNFVALIAHQTATNQNTNTIQRLYDYIIWYSKSENVKIRSLYRLRTDEETNSTFNMKDEHGDKYKSAQLSSTMNKDRLFSLGRLTANKKYAKRYPSDFMYTELHNVWNDTVISTFSKEKVYVVQTNHKTISRCLLLSTDPGDLVLDPTCGSGTTAYMAEQWGRRWITVDTSRIAFNLAKTRLTTASFPYYELYDEKGEDIRQGFKYKTVPHITLNSLAKGETPQDEILYDQPYEDKKKFRVSGPFTVETLQSLDVIAPEEFSTKSLSDEAFEERVFAHLKQAGIKNGDKKEQAIFIRIDRLNSTWLHAEGYYMTGTGERKAYLHIGPKFGTVSKQGVNEAIKECRARGDADWLVILGFSFDTDLENREENMKMGSFMVTKVRMHDDLMQEGLLKRDPKAASFVTIGEPEIAINKTDKDFTVEIVGLDIYDPITDTVKPRDVHDIAYWMIDDDYDGSNFMVRQIFFCGGDKDEFDKWKRGLTNLAKDSARKKANQTLKIDIDEDAFDRVYGHISHPISIIPGKQHKIAVRVISQFGEESTKVLEIK
jgi:adenine-specific DNA-methyltransferase